MNTIIRALFFSGTDSPAGLAVAFFESELIWSARDVTVPERTADREWAARDSKLFHGRRRNGGNHSSVQAFQGLSAATASSPQNAPKDVRAHQQHRESENERADRRDHVDVAPSGKIGICVHAPRHAHEAEEVLNEEREIELYDGQPELPPPTYSTSMRPLIFGNQ